MVVLMMMKLLPSPLQQDKHEIQQQSPQSLYHVVILSAKIKNYSCKHVKVANFNTCECCETSPVLVCQTVGPLRLHSTPALSI